MKQLITVCFSLFIIVSCSNDDDCPDEIIIETPEDLQRAYDCGLEPSGPLETVWISESYKARIKEKRVNKK